MATATLNLRDSRQFTDWFTDFLKKELAPYPGRGTIVARMVISATITMILVMTFRMPGASIGPLYAFIISREDLLSTLRSAMTVVLVFGSGAAFIPIGARMFASMPLTHFLWEGASLFAMFYLLRVLSDFSVAAAMAMIGSTALGIWYLPGPAELNVERTLWTAFVPAVAAAVTIAVEAVFHALNKQDEVLKGLTTRWTLVESLLQSYADNQPAAPETMQKLAQFALVGAGTLRRRITRSEHDPLYRTQMTAVVSLTARSVDFAAAMALEKITPTLEERERIRQLVQHIAAIRECLATRSKPPLWEAPRAASSSIPLLSELEGMVALIPRVFEGSVALAPYQTSGQEEVVKRSFFVDDALQNPEYIRYALSGGLAAMLCYILYVALAWPGLSTSVVTCLLTGLSDIGSSRQKQILRLAGAILGGFVFGMGAQIFVLPYVDSIVGFTLTFAAVSTIAAWVATSSPRLSYCGLQIAFAYYLVNINEFTIQTSLSIARDRAIGVLLGVFMMWLVFERFYPKTAAQQMIDVFIRNLRLLAQLTVFPASRADAQSIVQIRKLRDEIYKNFSAVNAQSDAVPFETGPLRQAHMAARENILRWQPVLRTFYLMEIPLLQFRLFGMHEEISESVREVEHRFQQSCGETLTRMADCLESQWKKQSCDLPLHLNLEKLLVLAADGGESALSAREKTLLGLSNNIALSLDRVYEEVSAVPLFQTPQRFTIDPSNSTPD